MTSFNTPTLHNASGEQTVRRNSYQNLAVEHNGTQMNIRENGTIELAKVKNVSGEEVELSRLEIPAGLAFKVEGWLKATRKVTFVTVPGGQSVKRFVHAPMESEYKGIQVNITEHGKVVLKDNSSNESLEVSASLIFKLCELLSATRKTNYVAVEKASSTEA